MIKFIVVLTDVKIVGRLRCLDTDKAEDEAARQE